MDNGDDVHLASLDDLESTLKNFHSMQDVNQLRTTCILQDITPGTYTIEVNPQDQIY